MKGFGHPETTKTWDSLYYREPLAIRFYDEAIKDTLALLNASEGDKVLDAGCGAGVHAIRAAQRGCLVDAMDFSRAALDDAQQRSVLAGVDHRIKFHHENLTKLSFADSSYSKIFSWGVLIHIPEVEQALDELARVLTPGGRLALYLCNAEALQFAPRRWETRWKSKTAKWRNMKFGYATEFSLHGDQIWLWHFHLAAIASHLATHGMKLVARRAGEMSDVHLRFPGVLGRICWRANNFWAQHRLSPRLAQMNLFVFEKTGAT